MNIFNRILIFLLGVAMLVAVSAVLIVTLDVVEPPQIAPNAWFEDRLIWFDELDGSDEMWAIIASVLFLVAGLALLFFELKPNGDGGRLTLKEDAFGRVTIARGGIVELANHEAMQVSGVRESRARVTDEKGQLHIHERVSIDPEAQVSDVTEGIRERIKTAVEHHVGWSVTKVHVDAQVQPQSQKARVR